MGQRCINLILPILFVKQVSSDFQISFFLSKHFEKDTVFDTCHFEGELFVNIEELLSVFIDRFSPILARILWAQGHKSAIIVGNVGGGNLLRWGRATFLAPFIDRVFNAYLITNSRHGVRYQLHVIILKVSSIVVLQIGHCLLQTLVLILHNYGGCVILL